MKRIWGSSLLALGAVLLMAGCDRAPRPAATPTALTSALLVPASTLPPYPPPATATPLSYPRPTSVPVPASPPATSLPTSTPLPTRTPWPAPTPIALPTIVPPIQPATADHLPRVTHDLLFLGQGTLMRWNHATGQIETLVGPEEVSRAPSVRKVAFAGGPPSPSGTVTSFSVSADGRKVALGRVKDAASYELAVLDTDTHQIRSLAEVTGLLGMSISPDGRWVAYVEQGSRPTATGTAGLAAPRARPRVGGGSRYGMIYAVATDAPNQRIEVGFCAEERMQETMHGCKGFLWSPNSQMIVWSDGRGVWLAELGGAGARKLASNTIVMPREEGGFYYPQAWSPAGHYLLLIIGYWEGSSYGVLDTQASRVGKLPNTFWYVGPSPHAIWMNDGRLLITRPAQYGGNRPPSIEIRHIDPTHEALSVSDEWVPIPVGWGDVPIAPMQLENGSLAFGLVNTSNTDYQARGLYAVGLNDRVPHKLNGLPPAGTVFSMEIVWAPDGSGAIVQDQAMGWLLYVPADDRVLYDLHPALGDWTCCFTWIK